MKTPRLGRLGLCLAAALAPALAAAQAPPAGAAPPPAVAPPPPVAPPPAVAPAPAPAPLAAASFPEAPAPAVNDHTRVVGSFGVGWFGLSNVPIAAENGGRDSIAAPAIGVRYWVNDLLGIDAGLGFATSSSSSEVGDANADGLSRTAFLVHLGVPLALAAGRHYIFEVVPEGNFAYASGNTGDATDVDVQGLRFEVGARAGTEIQFGFIGIPELALEGSVGLFLRSDSYKASPNAGDDIKQSDFLISTSNINNPWDFFRSNVAARYYF
ncbi:MAG TPA: hypothetical protein VFS43_26050 [Polyangiaceae bacterium]|nr:hypothetical protein [Polyangiaceae bacterium]